MAASETTQAWLQDYVDIDYKCTYSDERNTSITLEGTRHIGTVMAQWRKSCLQNANFIWQVGGAFVEKFPFAATVLCPPFQCPVHTSDARQIFYRGTVPKFALERIATAIMYGLSTITIHAFERLPTELRRVRYRDPVLICWERVPQITQVMRTEGRVKMYGTHSTLDGTGYVLAAWDYDKEIPLPLNDVNTHQLDTTERT